MSDGGINDPILINPSGGVFDSSTIIVEGLNDGLVGVESGYLINVAAGSNLTYDAGSATLNLDDSITLTGLNMSGNKITGVAAGTVSTDAVNYGQLTGLSSLYLALAGGTMSGDILVSGSINLGSAVVPWTNIYGTNVRSTNLYGTLQTAAQTNVTSLGTLTGLTVSGTTSLQGANVNSQKITNLANGSATNDAVNYGQLLSVSGAYLPLAGGTMTGQITSRDIIASATNTYNLGSGAGVFANGYINNVYSVAVNSTQLNGTDLTVTTAQMGNLFASGSTLANSVTNTDLVLAPSGTGRVSLNAAPTATLHAATKGYVDTSLASYLLKSGGTMTGAIAMGSNKITGLANGTVSADAVNYGQLTAGLAGYIPTIGSSTNTSLVRWSGTAGAAVLNSTWLLSAAGDLTQNNASRQIGTITSNTTTTTQTIQCTNTGQANIFLTDGTNSTNIRHWANFGYSEFAIPWECYFGCTNYYLRPSGSFKVYDTIGATTYTLEFGSSSATAATMFLNSTASSAQTIQFRGAGSTTGSIVFQQNATAANRTLTLNCASGSAQINAASLAPQTTAVTSLGTASLKYTSLNTTSLVSSTTGITWTDANSVTRKLASEETFAFVNSGNYSLTNTSGASVDSSTGVISFTVPSSGAVLISVYGGLFVSASISTEVYVGLSTNSGAQVYTSWDWGYISSDTYIPSEQYTPYFSRVYAGLTPGTAYTLYLKYRLSVGGSSIIWQSGNISPATNTRANITMSVRYLN